MSIPRWSGLVIGIGTLAVLLGSPVIAQAKKSAKQAESLAKAGENAKRSMQTALDTLGKLLTGYNSIIDGTAKNTQSAYKKLVGDLKNTEKQIQAVQKGVTAMDKEAQKFFAAWETDLESISSEDLRQKGADRLQAAKDRYASLGETLGQAGETLAPVIQDLNDQILFLGRDLSPGAIADVQNEAQALNQNAEAASAEIQSMLEASGSTDVDTGG